MQLQTRSIADIPAFRVDVQLHDLLVKTPAPKSLLPTPGQPLSLPDPVYPHRPELQDVPDPDLFIRTGGEQRISNFLLWNLAYTELFFTDQLWPEFDVPQFEAALAHYAARQRRFGLTTEQLAGAKPRPR